MTPCVAYALRKRELTWRHVCHMHCGSWWNQRTACSQLHMHSDWYLISADSCLPASAGATINCSTFHRDVNNVPAETTSENLEGIRNLDPLGKFPQLEQAKWRNMSLLGNIVNLQMGSKSSKCGMFPFVPFGSMVPCPPEEVTCLITSAINFSIYWQNT